MSKVRQTGVVFVACLADGDQEPLKSEVASFLPKNDVLVPHAQHVNFRIVSTPDWRSLWGVPAVELPDFAFDTIHP